MWRRWPPCRCNISLERFGNTASRPTCSAVSSRWLQAAGSARFCARAFSARSAWTTPPFSSRLASSRARRSRCRHKSTQISASIPNPTTEPPRFESGGSGLLSTLGDYARFLAMLSGGGALDGERILGPRTIRFMASDHLGPDVDRSSDVLPPGHGFGLGFGVRLQYGLAPTPGSVGDYFWGGWAGTTFRISPQELAVRDPHGAGARLSSPSQPDVRESLHRRPCLILDFPSIIPTCSRPP